MKHTPAIVTSVLAAGVVAAVLIVFAVASDDDTAEAVSSSTTVPSDTASPPQTDPVEIPSSIEPAVRIWETDWSRRTIDLEELILGIQIVDPRDRIAPLDFPAYETPESADGWLVNAEIGVQLVIGEVARFYPLRILSAHEVVNDETGGVPYALTYCPLCNTAAAFDRRVDGQVLRFGVSGLLRKSDLVMWDTATDSLWQQITGEGIVGDFAGTQLVFLPSATVTWGDFKETHPDGEALSKETGFGRNYGSNSYLGYTSRPIPYPTFFQEEVDPRFPALERVVGVRVGDTTKAYPFSVLTTERAVNDELAGIPVTVWWADTGAADNFDSRQPGEGQVIGTGIAFLATVDGQVLTFRPADDASFVDTETGTTWTLFGEAIDGPLTGTQLETALHQNEFWFAWAAFNGGSPVHGE